MAAVILTRSTMSVHLTRAEKVFGLLRDLEVPRADVSSVEVVGDALAAVHGLRAPGLDLPTRRKIGTWRRRGERTFVSVRRDQPAVRVRLRGQRYDTVLVGADEAAALAAALAPPPGPAERELWIDGPAALAGTLTVPPGATGPVPGAVLVSGSGPLDRDGNAGRARLDLSRQLAAALAGAGIASLRYDKRGAGRSPGDWRAAGLHDNADDLAAARDALAAQPEVDPDRLLLVGHSEGAILAASVAARGVPLAGVVLLACSARPGDELLRWQVRRIAPTLPVPVRALLRLFRVDLERKVAANHARVRASTTDTARIGGAKLNARWFREFLDHDPRADLRRVAVPVLALTGGKDLQVDPADLEVIAATVPGEVTVRRIDDLTHTLRRRPGRPAIRAYRGEVRRPVDRDVLDAVVDFGRRVTGLG